MINDYDPMICTNSTLYFSPGMGDPRTPMVIFTGQSHPSFAKDVCS